MKSQEIAELITIRNYTDSAINNISVKLSNEEVRALQSKLVMLDKKIVTSVMALDINAASVAVVASPKRKTIINETTK